VANLSIRFPEGQQCVPGAVLTATQTFSGANTHAGPETFTSTAIAGITSLTQTPVLSSVYEGGWTVVAATKVASTKEIRFTAVPTTGTYRIHVQGLFGTAGGFNLRINDDNTANHYPYTAFRAGGSAGYWNGDLTASACNQFDYNSTTKWGSVDYELTVLPDGYISIGTHYSGIQSADNVTIYNEEGGCQYRVSVSAPFDIAIYGPGDWIQAKAWMERYTPPRNLLPW